MQKRKGFTLVELVIVIAVIAILAGVLIGTFASVINRANASAEVQKTKSEEIAQKAEDILKKIEDSNWYGWEDFETSIVAKITQELKNQSTGLTEEQVKKIINDALTTWQANHQAGNTDLTKEQVKAIVENAVGTLHYEGVTEAQVRAIVNASGSSLASQLIQPVQIKQIVAAANANNLTAAQVASVVTSASNTTVEQLIAALNSSVEGLATTVQVETLRNEIKNMQAAADNDTVVIAKALNIMAKKSGVTNVETPTELFEKIGSYEKSNLKYVTAENKTNVLFDLATARFSVVDSDKKIVYSEDLTGTVDSVTYWVFVENYNDSLNYSQYLISQTTNTLTVDTGVDVGDCNVTNLTYQTDATQNVVIRTNSAYTTLTVNASTDSVKHYGVLGKLILTDIAYDCFYEYGKTAYAEATKGKIVAKEGGTVQVLFATAAAVAAVEDGGTIGSAYCVSTNEAEALSTGYNNFSDSKSGNVEFKYVDLDMNPITVESVAAIASDSQDKLKIEEIETSGLYEARIGTTGYTTFDEAASSILAGQTLVLLKDVVRVETVSVAVWDKPFNIDLNNHTYETLSDVDITLGNNGYKASAFCFSYDGNTEITIKNGTIKTKYGAPVYADSKTVVLENVVLFQDHENYVQTTPEYSSGVRITSNGAVVIDGGTFEGYYALAVSNSGGEYTINGGTFTGPLFFSTSTDNGVTKSFTINGGTFNEFEIINPTKGTVVITGGTFDADPTGYLVGGYVAHDNGNGTWTVVPQE